MRWAAVSGVIAALACVSCGGGASPRRTAPPVVQTAAPPTTSTTAPPRAVRAAPAPTTTSTPLSSALDRVLAGTSSCLTVTDGSGAAVLYSHASTLALAPASSQKLFVAAAALSRLGASYRFTTKVVAAAPPRAGRVGDLWLVGGGDPLLASPAYAAYLRANPATARYQTTDITQLAKAVRAAGVRTVAGTVHGDASRYEVRAFLPTWGPSINAGEFDVGPLGALEVDQGLDRWRPAALTADAATHAAGVLAAVLAGNGVAARWGADAIAPPAGVVLATVQSAPLADIVTAMLQASDNQIAELLTRELDRQAGGAGTTIGGVKVVMGEIARLGVPMAGVSLVDGSGLSQGDRATCSALLAALNLGDRPALAALRTGLPVAGVDGTLYNLFRGTPIAGRLAAKGGYLTNVTALVGRLSGDRPRRFAFVANGPFDYLGGVQFAQRVVDAIVTTT